MESKDTKDVHIIERLSKNLISSSEEVRERAANSLLLKLELKIIPRAVLLQHYHYIVGRCLECLNEHLTTLKPRTILDIIQILGHFAECQEGRDLVRRYGTLEFMSEFLEFVRKQKNGAISEQIENFIKRFYQTGSPMMHQSNPMEYAQSLIDPKPKQIKHEVRDTTYTRPSLTFKRFMEDLHNEFQLDVICPFEMKNIILIDQEKASLIELTTQLRFSNKKEIHLGSSLAYNILSTLRSFPLEIYLAQYSDVLVEILKLVIETTDRHLAVGIIIQLIDGFVKQVANNKRLGSAGTSEKHEGDQARLSKNSDGFLDSIYPPLYAQDRNLDNLYKQKLTISNICELIFRSYAALASEDGLTPLLSEKLCGLIEFMLAKVGTELQRNSLTTFLIAVAEFLEVTLLGPAEGKNAFQNGPIVLLSTSKLIFKVFVSIRCLYLSASESDKPWSGCRFRFNRFVKWAAQSLYSKNELEDLRILLHEADLQANKELEQFLELKRAITQLTDLSLNPTSNATAELASHIKRAVDYEDCVKALFAVQTDLVPFIETFATVHTVMSTAEFAQKLTNDELSSCKQYISGFVEYCQVIFFSQAQEEARIKFLSALKAVIKKADKVQTSWRTSRSTSTIFDTAVELIAALKKSNLMNLLILAGIENDAACVLFETQLVELLAEILSFVSDLESVCDAYLLANFLAFCCADSKPAVSLQSFLSTRSPWFAKLSAAVRMASKDVFVSYQSFYYLALGTSNDNSDILAHRKLHYESNSIHPKITANHPFNGLLDENGENRTLRSEIEILSSISGNPSHSFLTPKDLKDLYDILEIATNDNIDLSIRRGALQQIFEMVISLRNNREAKELCAAVANLAFEKLFKCEPGALSDVYLKILQAFWLHHSFNSNLKIRMLENLRSLCRNTEFSPLIGLLEKSLYAEDKQFRLNCLALAQIAVSSPILWENKYFDKALGKGTLGLLPKANNFQRLLQTLTEDSIATDTESDPLKISFFKAHRNVLHNFYGAKPAAFGPKILSSIGCIPEIAAIISHQRTFISEKERFVFMLVKDKISSAKNACLSNAKIFDPALPVCHMVSVTLLYRILIPYIQEHSQANAIIDLLRTFYREMIPKISGLAYNKSTAQVYALSLADFALSFASIGFNSNSFTKKQEEFFSEYIEMIMRPVFDQKLYGESSIADMMCLSLNIWCQLAPSFLNKLLSNDDKFKSFLKIRFTSSNMSLALEVLALKNDYSSLETVSLTCDLLQRCSANFTSPKSYMEMRAKCVFLEMAKAIYLTADQGTVLCNFDFYLRAKELIRSPHTEIRLRTWSLILVLVRKLDMRSSQNLFTEILFKCNEHLSDFIDLEHSVVNDQIISVVIGLLHKQHMEHQDEGPHKFEMWKNLLKKLVQKAHKFTMAGLAGLLSLCRLVGGGDASGTESSKNCLYEYLAEHIFKFLSVTRTSTEEPHDNHSYDKAAKMLIDLNQNLHLWVLSKYSMRPFDFQIQRVEANDEIPCVIPQLFLSQLVRYIDGIDSHAKAGSSFSCISYTSINMAMAKREINSLLESYLLIINELLEASTVKNNDRRQKNTSSLPSMFASVLTTSLKYLSLPFFFKMDFKNVPLLESVYSKLSSSIPSMQGLSQSDTINFILSLARILESYSFKNASTEETCLSSICFAIKSLKSQLQEFNVDQLEVYQKAVTAIVMNKISQKIGQIPSRIWQYRFPISWLSASSAHAKRAFLASSIPQLLQREVSLLLNNDSSDLNKAELLLSILRSLFLPLPSSKYSMTSSDNQNINTTRTVNVSNMGIPKDKEAGLFTAAELDGLKTAYLILAKSFTAGAESSVYSILTNWHYNKVFSSFLETIAVKNKHFVLDKAIETAKQSKTLREQNTFDALRFLKSIASIDFAANYIVKSKLPFYLSSRMKDLYLADKRDQIIQINLKAVTQILDLFLVLSFNKTTHLKLIEGGKDHFEVLKHYYMQSKDNALIKKFEVFFVNLLTNKTAKALFFDWPELLTKMQKKLILSSDREQQLLASQFFYNILYKDTSAMAMVDKKEFVREIELIISEVKTLIHRGESRKEVTRGAILLKNLRTIKDIILAS